MSEGGAKREQPKVCDRCGHVLIYPADTWNRMEWANGKWGPIKHQSKRVKCGGVFVAPAGQIRRAS